MWKHRAARAHCRLLGPCFKTGEKLPAPEILARTRSTHDVLSRALEKTEPRSPSLPRALSTTTHISRAVAALHTSPSSRKPIAYGTHAPVFLGQTSHARENGDGRREPEFQKRDGSRRLRRGTRAVFGAEISGPVFLFKSARTQGKRAVRTSHPWKNDCGSCVLFGGQGHERVAASRFYHRTDTYALRPVTHGMLASSERESRSD